MVTWTQHHPAPLAQLTARQREVLGLIANGRTNPEIAELLGISLAGAKWHVREVITRLGVSDREEAAEIWREEHSLPRRLNRFAAGVTGLGALKVALASATASGVVIAGVGAAVIARDMHAAGTQADAAVSASLPSVMSEDEATNTALDLAIAELQKYFVPQQASVNGRPFAVGDLRVVSARFVPNAGRVQFWTPASTWIFGDGRDIWAFELAASGIESPQFGSRLAMSLVIEDGGTDLLSRNIIWPESQMPGIAHYEPLKELVGTVVASDGQEFPLAASYNRSFWSLGLAVYDGDRLMGGTGNPVTPGDARHSAGEIFGINAWTAMGYGHLHGAVGDRVVRIEALTEDGRTATVYPQAPPAESLFPYRFFGFAFPGASWVVAAKAYDEAGNVVGSVSLSDHPWPEHDHPLGN